jgi:hypothetical protein
VSDLTKEQFEELTHWAQSRTLPAGDVFRARLMLALAEGKSWSQIEIELQTSRPTIARWKSRFEQQGIAGLDPRHRGSEPGKATPSLQARILRQDDAAPGRRQHALDVPQDGYCSGIEQIDGAAGVAAGSAQAAPIGSIHGQR